MTNTSWRDLQQQERDLDLDLDLRNQQNYLTKIFPSENDNVGFSD
jgi:hypothetical protein